MNLVLPQSKKTYPDCIDDDFDDYWQMTIPENLKAEGFKYYDYFFDTIIQSTSLAFTFRCLGGSSMDAITERFQNEYSRVFNEMAATAKIENHECLYFVVSDSVKMERSTIKYSRYREYTLGGAGSLGSSEQFVLKPGDLFKILNSTENSALESPDLLRFRLSKKHF